MRSRMGNRIGALCGVNSIGDPRGAPCKVNPIGAPRGSPCRVNPIGDPCRVNPIGAPRGTPCGKPYWVLLRGPCRVNSLGAPRKAPCRVNPIGALRGAPDGAPRKASDVTSQSMQQRPPIYARWRQFIPNLGRLAMHSVT